MAKTYQVTERRLIAAFRDWIRMEMAGECDGRTVKEFIAEKGEDGAAKMYAGALIEHLVKRGVKVA